ncbi:MAG: xanthine dehydrogenase YagS FAD-binding subunit [Gaiellaceae bacterium]|nr:xanthine dehydrogenase YagS FAD-binding subunit [Gaiellaceae bacterium]
MELLRPSSLDEASASLGNGSRALAGGTELVPLLRDGLVQADTLVEIGPLLPRGVSVVPGPVYTSPGAGAHKPMCRIGAATSLAELEVDPQIPDALREACRLAASPQLRNMGSVGGNLLQATRCWYWRLKYPCYLHGGDICHAKAGEHREHAIFGNERCASAHPSDVAAALVALNASMRTTSRELPVAELYRLPTDDDRDVTTLEPGELILELDVPATDSSVYLKAMERQRYAFPLVGVAAARTAGTTRIALAGVAPTPWLLASPDALDGATPLPRTAYKVDIARALVRRAVASL